jgi:hypothetical protein
MMAMELPHPKLPRGLAPSCGVAAEPIPARPSTDASMPRRCGPAPALVEEEHADENRGQQGLVLQHVEEVTTT